jgi:hypothetical protein
MIVGLGYATRITIFTTSESLTWLNASGASSNETVCFAYSARFTMPCRAQFVG